MKVFVLLALALPALLSCSKPAQPAQAAAAASVTATKYFVAHQGGYIGEATVTIDSNQKVDSRQPRRVAGPGRLGRVQLRRREVAGRRRRRARSGSPRQHHATRTPQVKGYMFYIYNLKADKAVRLVAVHPRRKDAFARPTRQFERDFEGLMANPIRAAAYARPPRRTPSSTSPSTASTSRSARRPPRPSTTAT